MHSSLLFLYNFPLLHIGLKSVPMALASPPTNCWIYAVEIITSVSKRPILSPQTSPLLFPVHANGSIVFCSLPQSISCQVPSSLLSIPTLPCLFLLYSSHSSLLIGLLAFNILPPNHLSHLCWIKLPGVDYITAPWHTVGLVLTLAKSLKSDVSDLHNLAPTCFSNFVSYFSPHAYCTSKRRFFLYLWELTFLIHKFKFKPYLTRLVQILSPLLFLHPPMLQLSQWEVFFLLFRCELL